MGMGRKGKRIPIFISIIYEAYVCQIETLHLNSLSSNVLHRMVKFFICCNTFIILLSYIQECITIHFREYL